MAETATFRMTNPRAPRLAVGPDIRRMATHLAADAEAGTPRRTGRMAASYQVEPGSSGDPATWVVTNTAPYARFVEYGTKHMRARAPLGRATAAARGRL